MIYKHNADAVKPYLVKNANKQLLCKVDVTIHVPVRFMERRLGQIGTQTFSYGCFPIINDQTGEYGVINVPTLIELNPFKTSEITIDGTDYYCFNFKAGQVVFKTLDVVRRENILFNIFDELIFKGKVPWYMTPDDLSSLFIMADKYAGSKIGATPEVMELLTSIITRSKKNRSDYVRHVAVTYKDFEPSVVTYVPLMSVYWSVNSTVNKLAGSYMSDGVISAIVNPTDRIEKIEAILRA